MHIQNKQLTAKEVFIQVLEMIGKSTLEAVQELLLLDYIDRIDEIKKIKTNFKNNQY